MSGVETQKIISLGKVVEVSLAGFAAVALSCFPGREAPSILRVWFLLSVVCMLFCFWGFLGAFFLAFDLVGGREYKIC